MAKNNQATSSNASNQSRSRNGSSAPSRQQGQPGQSRSGASRSSGGGGGGGGSSSSRSRSSGSSDRSQSRGGSSRSRSGGNVSRGGIRGIPARAVSSVREHPIPASVIGAGLAWLVLESTGLVATGVGRRTVGTLGDLGATFGDSFTGAAKSTRKTVRKGASSVAGTVGGAVKSGASAVGRGVSHGVTASRDAVVHTIENHPVAVCSAALAAGILTGMMLPSTMREARLMGRRSAKLVDEARRTGSEFLEEGKGLAEEAVESVHRGQQRAAGAGGGTRNRRRAAS